MLQMLRGKSDTPSNFTLKLRKHLRTRRLDDVRQLGVDRLVDFSFGTGPNCHHLLLELYAQVHMLAPLSCTHLRSGACIAYDYCSPSTWNSSPMTYAVCLTFLPSQTWPVLAFLPAYAILNA